MITSALKGPWKNDLIFLHKRDLSVGLCFIPDKSQDRIVSPPSGKQDIFNLLRRIAVTS